MDPVLLLENEFQGAILIRAISSGHRSWLLIKILADCFSPFLTPIIIDTLEKCPLKALFLKVLIRNFVSNSSTFRQRQ